ELLPVTIQGWKRPAFLHRDAKLPRRVNTRALVSPFDSLVWDRARALALFGFDYRIEIYVPGSQRRFGYYVLPFLLGDELVGRVDLKADRAGGALLVQSAWVEPDRDDNEVAGALLDELRLMTSWLGLDRLVVTGAGDLGPTLARLA
ncbi:MAG TPA: crosslink repair DNA glycosylase YcaQ family protein, partial [Iamia sp.]|nr:crosslink repair DNA glycosylase YcaQ family protein [Iamia sp.]